MMHRALDGLCSVRALGVMIRGNVMVDAVWNQFGRHELHFDDNAFEAAYAYMAEEQARVQTALEAGKTAGAWRAFGRLTHTAQDFYSHSNYVDLWIACHPDGRVPAPAQIDPFDEDLINSPALRSGRPYMPLGLLSFIPIVGRWFTPLLPRDSHAHMNLDSAARGPMFEYAFQAAVKRTRLEYDRVARSLSTPLLDRFRDLPT
jgi:hypothetical protein